MSFQVDAAVGLMGIPTRDGFSQAMIFREPDYHEGMVDNGLLDQVMRLDEASRLELRDAIEASVDAAHLTPELERLLRPRVVEDDVANRDEYTSLADDERATWARRRPSA